MAEDRESEDSGSKLQTWITFAGVAGVTLLVLTIGFGLYQHFAVGGAFAGLGEFGDFVGGLANPLLALLGFLALLYTIALQQKELGYSRSELELTRIELKRSATALENQSEQLNRQNASRAFFDLFEMYKSVVTSVERGTGDKRATGKAALEKFAERFYPYSIYARGAYSLEQVQEAHSDVNSDLGNYFRLIYRILAYLSSVHDQSDFYADMFRAQLSTAELHLLFFNCLSEVGAPMMQFSAEFALFDNMPIPPGDGLESILHNFDADAFGKNRELLVLLTSD